MRQDGKKVKNLSGLMYIVPYIMEHRHDAQNLIRQTIDLDHLHTYLRDVKSRGHHMSTFTLIIAAYLRTVSQLPYLNRFVINRKIYARNRFSVSYVVLKEPTGAPNEDVQTNVKTYFELTDTIFDVDRKIREDVHRNRQQSNRNKTDNLIRKIMTVPLLPRLIVSLLKAMDNWGWMPKSVLEASPFHTGLFISNLASIRTNYIYHHLYDFGSTSIFVAMGNPVRRLEMVDGKVTQKKYLPLGIVTDERICSGHDYAMAFREFEKYIRNPWLLETPPEKVFYDET
ncbi:MAG: hypothetical protein ACOX17_08325 [Christensenellales bacterium]|jgi:hypothetical protein